MLKFQRSIAFNFQTSHYSALLVRISVKLISFFICIKFFIQLLIEWNVHTSIVFLHVTERFDKRRKLNVSMYIELTHMFQIDFLYPSW